LLVITDTQLQQAVITYKSNKFCVTNESAFQQFLSSWKLDFISSYAPDDRVAFRGNTYSSLPVEFWTELSKYVSARWVVSVMEYDLTMAGFAMNVHLVTSKGEHEFIPQVNLKFKDSVSEAKRKKYLGIIEKKTTSNIRLDNRPYKIVEARR
jgi:hypothetical protein